MSKDDRRALAAFAGLILLGLLALVMYVRESHAMTGVRTYEPRTIAQANAMNSLEPECCYSGRVFGGKSWIGCAKAYRYACRYEGARVLIAREERASMEGTTLVTLRNEIVPAEYWASCWKESKSMLRLPNGSEIHVLGLDRPERILSARYGFVFVDQAEQLDRNQFELLNSRITQVGMPWHQLFLAFNPEHPEHWAFKRYRPDMGDGVREDVKGRVYARVVHVGEDDLMDLLSDASRARLDGMEGAWRERLRLGRWVAFEGSIYGAVWDPGRMIVEAPESWAEWDGFPPADWSRYRALDFGAQNPFVCQWWAESPDGVFYRYREVYRTGGTQDDWARWICEQEERELAALRSAAAARNLLKQDDAYLRALNVVLSVSDHDAGARIALARSGIATALGDKEMPAGLLTVMGLMRSGRILFVRDALVGVDESLKAARKPCCTEQEFAGYRWQKDRATGSEVGPRDVPLKENDHGMDAMRYLFHTKAGALVSSARAA